MNTKKLIVLWFAIFSIVSFVSCDSLTSALEGPAGEDGVDGEDGEQGPPGEIEEGENDENVWTSDLTVQSKEDLYFLRDNQIVEVEGDLIFRDFRITDDEGYLILTNVPVREIGGSLEFRRLMIGGEGDAAAKSTDRNTPNAQRVDVFKNINIETVGNDVRFRDIVWAIDEDAFSSETFQSPLFRLSELEFVGGTFRARDNYGVDDTEALISMPELREVQNRLLLNDVILSGSLKFSNLEKVGNDIHLHLSDDTEDIHFPELVEVGGYQFLIAGIGGSTSISFDSLLEVPGLFSIYDNDSLEEIDFPDLSRVGGTFSITENPELPTSNAEDLRDQVEDRDGIGGTVTIEDNK